MNRLLKRLGLNAQGMQDTHGINRRHVAKFERGEWASASREELQILFTLSEPEFRFLSLEVDEIWRTFGEAVGSAYLSQRRNHTTRPEDLDALKLLLQAGLRLEYHPVGEIASHLETQNCVVIGSPKNNPACETAFAAIAEKAGGCPLYLRWDDWNSAVRTSRFCGQSSAKGQISIEVEAEEPAPLRDGRSVGINLLRDRRPKSRLKKVDLKTTRPGSSSYGWDFGFLLVWRKPLATSEDVTTIVFGGLTGFSTKEIATDLNRGILFIDTDEIRDNVPVWRILCCPWRRRGQKLIPHSGGRRWINPRDWKELQEAADASKKKPPKSGLGSEED